MLNVQSALTAARNLLGLLKDKTATKVDDELFDLVVAIDDSPKLKEWVAKKFEAQAAGVLSIESEPTEELALELRERKIEWAKLIQYLPVLLQVLKTFAG